MAGMIAPYPFSAIVGLADLRLALLLNAVSPTIGGVLVRGEKGTAKSTMVRALAALLPDVAVVGGCRFACDPAMPDPRCPDGPHGDASPAVDRPARLVELPVGATEDRVVGALDLRRALADGVKSYEPGLLAAAHRGVLYVDEVNLLPDHLVDLLLDAAAMGEAYVERDGVSVRHDARFLLVGTMNPEEGELRPQLLDRFGLTVDVAAPRDAAPRAEVVRRRLAYERDPAGFAAGWSATDRDLVDLPDAELTRIATVCAAFEVDGLRADIVVARAAVALAAWHGRRTVGEADIRDAARLALPHRRRRDPFDAPGLDEDQLDKALDAARQAEPDPDPDPDPRGGGAPPPPAEEGATPPNGASQPGGASQSSTTSAADPPYRTRLLSVPGTGSGARAGRRSPAFTRSGRIVAARTPRGRLTTVHLPATITAAAAAGRRRITAPDLRETVHKGRESNLVLFVVDASGSMAARQRMRAVKGAVLSLLRDAYQRRDKVGLITFRADGADLVLPPTTSTEVAAARLRELRTGGRTPLAAALTKAARTVRTHRLRDPHRRALVVLVTDGRHTNGPDPSRAAAMLHGTATVVVDCESGPVRLGLAARLATTLGAEYLRVDQLSAGGLRDAARTMTRKAA
jgi:magnesium chelatase subunit D